MEKPFCWELSDIFKGKFVTRGSWKDKFYFRDGFPRAQYVSADTETKNYHNGKLLSEEDSYRLYKDNGADWCRKNIETKAYAYMLSDGDGFALFEECEDFLLCCAMLMVKYVFWYNAKFDFALFDNFFCRNDWTFVPYESLVGQKKRRLSGKFYQTLDGDFGERYQMRIWQPYINKKGAKKTHNFKMVDICNIFGGGLKKNLEDWKIVDKTGEDVRKLEMDYVNGRVETDLQYMINDTKGLHLLAEKINETIGNISGFSLFDGDFLTAGGLAKKSLLKIMYGGSVKQNMEQFHMDFPMTPEQDKWFREMRLYQGGKCFVSPYKVGTVCHNIYKYDINSMYPTQMRNMKYPYGEATHVKRITDTENYVYVLHIKNICGTLKPNMVPVWYDAMTGKYVAEFHEEEERLMWLEEMAEMTEYYYIDYEVVDILRYKADYCKGAQDYVDTYYQIKKTNKGAIRSGAKLFLNSAYGKLAQRIEHVSCHYELTEDGYAHLVKGNVETDEGAIMSVLVGSRITALSRVLLCYYIRTICKGNPKKYFLYCDTDSVHALCPYDDCDDSELGKMKCEGIFESAKYLAPKTYMVYNELGSKVPEYEIHTKGVNTKYVKQVISKCKTFEEACEKFSAGVEFRTLSSLNVNGGKALIYVDKMLLNPKRAESPLKDDELEDY